MRIRFCARNGQVAANFRTTTRAPQKRPADDDNGMGCDSPVANSSPATARDIATEQQRGSNPNETATGKVKLWLADMDHNSPGLAGSWN
jgi:hypothetical protein